MKSNFQHSLRLAKPQWEEESELLLEEEKQESNEIMLYNDDYNTFEHVIYCLVRYCKHHPFQAEQCAYIVHHNGKCSVKTGSFKELKPICEALLEKGLSARIE
ncbi:MAG: ATP-dependent Clp protease adaptor ClpS [Bacteroidia bacterium]|nr:ATP-dependent Clp protease adaptor ClpS [Bacteroidia bacterium]